MRRKVLSFLVTLSVGPLCCKAPTFQPVRIVFAVPELEDVAKVLSKWEQCTAWKNPGCLMYAAQQGATRNAYGYATFSTEAEGAAALRTLLARRLARYGTLYTALAAWGSRERVIEELKRKGFLVAK